MRALVLGATGHVGNAVVRELLSRGFAVTAATRRTETPPNLAGLAASLVRGEADRPGQVREWLRGHDLLVDAAAPYPLHLFDTARGSGRTRELLAVVAARGARFAYVSSFVTLHPGTGLSRGHPYFAVKQRIESEVLAAARAGLPAVVVNPTTCFGPWDLKPRELCFVPQLLSGEVAALVRHAVNAVDVRDVAAGLVSAVEQERFGEPIPLCGHDVALDELATRLCAAGGARPPLWRVPLGLALASSWWAEACFTLLTGRPSPWPVLGLMLVNESRPMVPGRVQLTLGAAPRPLDETLRDAIAWYRKIGYC